MVNAVTALKPDAPAGLEGEHPPAVDLLLVDPAVTAEGFADQDREHGRVLAAA
jgi:hypothetical protein